MNEERRKKRRFDDEFKPEVTIKTQAAINLVRVAKATGIFERLVTIVLGMCDTIQGEASDPPRLGERRKGKWRGEEDREKGIACSDLTGTTGGGESSLLDQMGTELWNRFSRKKKQRERRKRRG